MTARGPDDDWSSLHGDITPSPVVRGWLRFIRVLASGPVLRIPPDVLSLAGVMVLAGACAVVVMADLPALAVPLIVAAGVLDGLDGAVALRTGRARPLGAVVDATADRIGDLLLGAVLLALGVPPGWVAAALVLVFLLEYVRARAQAAGMPGVGVVTIAERPTRLIVVALAAGGAAAFPEGLPLVRWDPAVTLTIVWTVVGAVAVVQLLIGIVRSMPSTFPPDR